MGRAFPAGFLWGAATAAHQVEGNNLGSDAWVMENMAGSMFREPSGDAVDFYSRYRDDVAMAAAIGFNAFRFSVEWARIEPERGRVSRAGLDHYSRLVDCCLEHGITPVVTLHHFTSPRWLVNAGGWGHADTAERFAAYAGLVVGALGDRVRWYCTINEVNTPLQVAGNGLLAPALTQRLQDWRADAARAFGLDAHSFVPFFPYASDEANIEIVAQAHRLAVDAIHAAQSTALAGATLSMQEHVADPGGEDAAARADEVLNGRFLRDFGTVGDFVGVQNYSRLRYDATGRVTETENLSGNGLPMVAGTLAATCRQAHTATGRPVLVTEHGTDLGDAEDHRRAVFVLESLGELHSAIADGIDVRGYLHWSLVDNFEWFKGYEGSYGLVGVDRATQRRSIRPSAVTLGGVARANSLPA